MKFWIIKDDTVVEALRKNGFTCEKPKKPEPIAATLSFHFQSQEEVEAGKRAEAAQRGYETNCPIEWRETYTLADGRVLFGDGTILKWKS